MRGGISSVEQLICDYLPPYASIRHVATMTEGAKLANAAVFARAIFALSPHARKASNPPSCTSTSRRAAARCAS